MRRWGCATPWVGPALKPGINVVRGHRPDVGCRLARAYRLCTHGMLLIPVDFRHGRGADQGASLGQGGRVGSEGEPDLRGATTAELWISTVYCLQI